MNWSKLFAVAALFLLTACNESSATLDTSSDDAMRASVQRMSDGLPDEKKQKLIQAMMVLTVGEAMNNVGLVAAAASMQSPNAVSNIAAPLKGKTADQIIQIADARVAERKAKQPPPKDECKSELLSVSSWKMEPVDESTNLLTVTLKSHSAKPIRMIDASIGFEDALGGHIASYAMSRDANIPANGTFTETNRWGPHTFERLLTLKPEEVGYCVRVKSILYEDGSKEQF